MSATPITGIVKRTALYVAASNLCGATSISAPSSKQSSPTATRSASLWNPRDIRTTLRIRRLLMVQRQAITPTNALGACDGMVITPPNGEARPTAWPTVR
jgi:hypothetical protein